MKNGIIFPKRRVLHFGQKLASIHQVSRANLRSSSEAPVARGGKERTLVEIGIGEIPETYKKFHSTKRKPDQALRKQLQKHPIKPEGITLVIKAHLHFDHCGNSALILNACRC